ncbi:MAG TPA: outer membrane beta-barrel protein [Croceibacterium sp.]|nr:outer membrane beta-barrel protein [Croceibacterium sp.]
MSKFGLTAPVLALAATAAPASAQDTTWTGFYIGAHGATADTNAEWTGTNIYQTVDGAEGGFTVVPHSDAIAHELSNAEIGGGGRIGFNWQAGSFVLGAEADATLYDFDRSVTRTMPAASYTLRSRASHLETVRARAGVSTGRVLLFLTGGVAFSNLRHSLAATDMSQVVIDGGEGGSSAGAATANLAAAGKTGTGWTVGGGGEVQASDRLSIALTVLHVDFGSEALAASSPPSSIATTIDSRMLVGMLGANLRF